MEKTSTARRLVESAMLIAIATVLSIIKLVDMPYGGSVTLASLFPIVLIAYRYGTGWGLITGLVYGVIQLILGSHNLSYVAGAASVIALILLDYLLAFGAAGLAGLFRNNKSQPFSLVVGSFLAAFLRYIFHVISGATVWAGLSIPTADALKYSFVYNATYMLPELLIILLVSYYLSTTLDFSHVQLKAIKKPEVTTLQHALSVIGGLVLSAALVYDVASVFAVLQDPESGEFNITAISTAPWTMIAIITGIAVAIFVVLFVFRKKVVGKAA